LVRWRALARIAGEDVALVKLFEGHWDALAIMAELGAPEPPVATAWGTWAAEPPTARLMMSPTATGVRLDGRKSWCSGAGTVDHAVVTAWDEDGNQCMVAVSLDQAGVEVTGEGWHAVGMGRSNSGDVLFHHVQAQQLGRPGDYTSRPGFWHGGAGIAACWYGATLPFVRALTELVERRSDPHAAAHLGAVTTNIAATRALLRESAAWIDENPFADAQAVALRARAAAEHSAALVLDRAGRALGAGPLCRDGALAQRFADLPVFVRQSHAERDLAELGRITATGRAEPADEWLL
jgi:alkylation response protein AidB-like acyl-CoA dehydrogenase